MFSWNTQCFAVSTWRAPITVPEQRPLMAPPLPTWATTTTSRSPVSRMPLMIGASTEPTVSPGSHATASDRASTVAKAKAKKRAGARHIPGW